MNVFCSAIGKIYKYNDKTQYFLKFISLNKITTHWHSANGHLLLLRHFRISTFYPFPMSFYGFITSPIFVLEKFRKWWAQLFISGVVKNQFQVCPQIQYLAALFHLWNFLCKSTFSIVFNFLPRNNPVGAGTSIFSRSLGIEWELLSRFSWLWILLERKNLIKVMNGINARSQTLVEQIFQIGKLFLSK